ncbi:MAG: ArsA family ATPase [Oligoflexales bacterium]
MTKKSRVFVVVGPGGVGKTTCSIALAMAGVRRGLKVGLLSVDPAKRLAKALKIPLDASMSKVECEGSGELHAAMVDQQAIFDQLVRSYAPKKNHEKIFHHPFYVSASQQIAGPFEAMALVQLAKMQKSFDWIVLDTPPDAQALEFLERPKVMARFMRAGVMKWILSSFRVGSRLGIHRLAKFGERWFQGVGEVAGVKALLQVADFLTLMQEVVEGVAEGSEVADTMLSDPTTQYVGVMSPKDGAYRVMKTLRSSLKEIDRDLTSILVNRCLPDSFQGSHSLPSDLKIRLMVEEDLLSRLHLPHLKLEDQWGGIADVEALQRLADILHDSLGEICLLTHELSMST